MRSFDKLVLFVLLVPTVSSLVISSVYAGKKKFKTFSFGSHLPAIVKVQPHRFHLTFRQNKYLRTPQFKIEGTLPLKLPTIIKDIIKPDPNPEVTEYNIGHVQPSHEEPVYVESNNHPSIAQVDGPHMTGPPHLPPPSEPFSPYIPPNNVQRFINPPYNEYQNNINRHQLMKRSANDYTSNTQFHSNSQNPYFSGNYGQNFRIPPQTQPNVNNYEAYNHNEQQYQLPPNGQNYLNPHNDHNSHSHNPNMGMTPFNNYNLPHNYQQHSSEYIYQNNPVIHPSSTSFTPPKYEKVFVSPDTQNTGWTPITSGQHNYLQPPNNLNSGQSSNRVTMTLPNYGNADENSKKVNIGEHYNPSASYLDQSVTQPEETYEDPDEGSPDEGSISFSISGPHGGEQVPIGYEAKIRDYHEQLKKYPDQLPPGLDHKQLLRYYHHQTFTDNLKNDYGFVDAIGPLKFLKSKLSSLKKFI